MTGSDTSASRSVPGTGRWVLAATILGSSLAFIDGTVVNVALPVLQRELNASATAMLWIVESYALLLAALILVGGSLGDYLGRRLIYGIGVALFAAASIACGISQNTGQLIAARAVQGIGGALLVPGSLAIISATFEGDERGRAIGTWSGATSITSALGPVLGGWLVEHVSWRAIFFLNVPLAVIVLVLVWWRVPESRDDRAARLDWWGATTVTAGLGALVFGLIEASQYGLGNGVVIVALVVGVASGINNAVSRLASLLAIAVLGLVMATVFDSSLQQRSAPFHLTTSQRQQLSVQQSRLAEAEAPPDLDTQTKAQIDHAIDASFIAGFRVVMFIASGLALLSAVCAGVMVEDRPSNHAAGSAATT